MKNTKSFLERVKVKPHSFFLAVVSIVLMGLALGTIIKTFPPAIKIQAGLTELKADPNSLFYVRDKLKVVQLQLEIMARNEELSPAQKVLIEKSYWEIQIFLDKVNQHPTVKFVDKTQANLNKLFIFLFGLLIAAYFFTWCFFTMRKIFLRCMD